MYNQRELLAYDVMTSALQAANQDASSTPEQPQVTDSVDGENRLTSCQNQAGDHSGCPFHGNPASKMPSGSCVTIPLTKGLYATIDAADFEVVSRYSWAAQETTGGVYAKTWVAGKNLYIHRVIMEVIDSKIHVDHRNQNTLDNRRENLRLTDKFGNARNRAPNKRRKHTRYKGVTLRGKRWEAKIKIKGEVVNLGRFETDIEAALAYDRAARELFGEFAYLNFPEVSNV